MKNEDNAITGLAEGDFKTQDLVNSIQTILAKNTFDAVALKHALMSLLEYLSSSVGRTDANCRAVDSFFMFNDLWVNKNLPDQFHDIFGDMAGALHDTVSAPEIAYNFYSTPEQLLERVKQINTEQPTAGDA